MTAKYLAAALTVVLLVLPMAGQKPSALPPDQGRYQLLPVEIGERGTTSKQLFLFDSQTGRVWHYRPESVQENGPGKEPIFLPEALIPVTIWSPASGQKVLPESN
jgi:hypothetical protein